MAEDQNKNKDQNQNDKPTPPDVSSVDANTTPVARETVTSNATAKDSDNKVSGGEYVVLDVVLYRLEGKGEKRRTRRYRRGQTVKLNASEARTLLAEPRPSVREKDKDGN